MKKETEQPGPINASKQSGNRVYEQISASNQKSFSTGSAVLDRTREQTPENESLIRGTTYTREEMEHEHRTTVPIIPYEVFEEFMVQHGAILVDEGAV